VKSTGGGFFDRLSGQSPERLKAHMKNQGKFDLVTLRAKADEPDIGGDYYGLRGRAGARRRSNIRERIRSTTPTFNAKDGGGTFRARFGVGMREKQPDGS